MQECVSIRCLVHLLVVGLMGLGFAGPAAAEEPVGLYLTWQQDPTTTMTIDWQTEPGEDGAVPGSVLRYKQLGTEDWEEVEGAQHAFPFSDRTIHRIELTGLEPATYYRFRVGDFARAYTFRTMPADLSEPLRFATGGDLSIGESFRKTNRAAMVYEPDFLLWGGDLPYANGDPRRVGMWHDWFAGIMETLIDGEGRVVPIVVAIGNHELFGVRRLVSAGEAENLEEAEALAQRRWGFGDGNATYFFDLFAFPGRPAYNVLDFGGYLSLFILDSDHVNPVAGEQTAWLEEKLKARSHVAHVIPCYHVPAYPSHRPFDGSTSRRIREQWVPLFEEHGVRVAFENHDHTYKRTVPIRDGKVDPAGIVYIGDGAWGVGTRAGDHKDQWYIDTFASERHAIIVTLHGPHQHFLVVNEDGDVIDEYPRTPQRPAGAKPLGE